MRRSRHCKLLSREINFQRAPFSVARKLFEREGTLAKNNLFLEHPRGRSGVCWKHAAERSIKEEFLGTS